MPIASISLQDVAASVRRDVHQWGTDGRTKSPGLDGLNNERRRALSSLQMVVPAIEPTRILIVDDLQSTVPLEQLLHSLGYSATRVAASGANALEMAQDFSPSVILISLDLPDMDAYDVAQRLRERTDVRRLRLIALTGDYAHDARDQARQAGFERYLAKPVSGTDLQKLLRANLS
jgi:CheY-like chemotaxis protein